MKKQKTSMEDELDPDSLVRCIQHCSLFSPDCEFGKDKLVQMWIAEGCIEVEGTKRAEDIAGLYFDALVHQEVLIPSKYQGLKYKVNTSQASTQFLKQGQYLRVDDANLGEIQGEALHLTWHCEKLDQTLSHALKHFEQLRTLRVVVDSVFLNKQLPCGITGILLGLKNLINLDLSRAHILELPISIGLVKTLNFFDISENPIKQLPESTHHLSCLQTLKLKGCVGVRELPREFRNLKKLRHLDLDIVSQLTSMPKGMGDLTELQTLQGFIVGKDDGRGIRELKNMNEITGRFCITRLENVSSAEEAKEASLADKKLIDKLELRWYNPQEEPSQDTAEILECLRPHFHLRELGIIGFSGWKLPSWISNPHYVELASITLFCCTGCHFLPSIGKLPSLKILTIIDMDNVRDINTLFYPRTGNQRFNAFPRLEKLTLDGMLNLEKWTGVEDGDLPCLNQLSITSCPKLTILPSMSGLRALRHLEVICCPQLISLPEGLSLESLIIGECPKVKERCRKDGGEDWVKIANVRELWIDYEEVSTD